jgi:hypothetical protein
MTDQIIAAIPVMAKAQSRNFVDIREDKGCNVYDENF